MVCCVCVCVWWGGGLYSSILHDQYRSFKFHGKVIMQSSGIPDQFPVGLAGGVGGAVTMIHTVFQVQSNRFWYMAFQHYTVSIMIML